MSIRFRLVVRDLLDGSGLHTTEVVDALDRATNCNPHALMFVTEAELRSFLDAKLAKRVVHSIGDDGSGTNQDTSSYIGRCFRVPPIKDVDSQSYTVVNGRLTFTRDGEINRHCLSVINHDVLIRRDGLVDRRSRAAKQGDIRFNPHKRCFCW